MAELTALTPTDESFRSRGRCFPEAAGLLVEIGAGQAADVLAIVEQFGFGDVMIDRDLAGHDRVVAARRLDSSR